MSHNSGRMKRCCSWLRCVITSCSAAPFISLVADYTAPEDSPTEKR